MKLLTVSTVRNSNMHQLTDADLQGVLDDFRGCQDGGRWISGEEVITLTDAKDGRTYHYLRANIISITEFPEVDE